MKKKRMNSEVKEIKEVYNYNEVNKHLDGTFDTKTWILLDIFIDTQLCFQTVSIPNRDGQGMFNKVQPFDKVI